MEVEVPSVEGEEEPGCVDLERRGGVPHLIAGAAVGAVNVGLLHEGARILRRQGSHQAIGLVQTSGRVAVHILCRFPDPDMEPVALVELEIDGRPVPVRRTALERDLPVGEIEGQVAILELRRQDWVRYGGLCAESQAASEEEERQERSKAAHGVGDASTQLKQNTKETQRERERDRETERDGDWIWRSG